MSALQTPMAAGGIRRLAILGAGTEGRWLAQRAARAGYLVVLEDLMPSKRRAAANQIGEVAGPAGRITYAASVEEAAREADLVIDFVPDELESKLEIFSMLDRMAPPYTIFATPTRVLSIADLASCTYRADRCVSLRLPDHLDESDAAFEIGIVQAPGSLPEVVDAIAVFWTSLGAVVALSVDRAALP